MFLMFIHKHNGEFNVCEKIIVLSYFQSVFLIQNYFHIIHSQTENKCLLKIISILHKLEYSFLFKFRPKPIIDENTLMSDYDTNIPKRLHCDSFFGYIFRWFQLLNNAFCTLWTGEW